MYSITSCRLKETERANDDGRERLARRDVGPSAKAVPTIDPTRLDDLALDLWRDEKLRVMPPERAADEWLRPIVPGA